MQAAAEPFPCLERGALEGDFFLRQPALDMTLTIEERLGNELGHMRDGMSAKDDIDVIDVGVPVLSMHSPYEIVSKIDTYMAYKAFKVFFTK